MEKRAFLQSLGQLSLGAVIAPELLAYARRTTPDALARDADFWDTLRAGYRLVPDYVNLENGYYSMQSEGVLERYVAHVRAINYQASRYMRTRQTDDALETRRRLAALAGCAVEELIVTRNTTESLDTVIAGYDWRAGDEAVMAAQDYGAMLDQFRLMARRHGVVNRVVSLPFDPASDDEVVQLYANAISPKTRLLMVCHLVNITGHVLPIAKIAAMAHARGVDVMVDGAHAFAQLDFRLSELGVDYYGASLHKWLGAPLGAGLLYVRRDKIAGLWPVFGDAVSTPDDDIRKLNHRGTHPVHTDLAIRDAIDAHEAIGIARKEARLRWLQRYWSDQVRGQPNIVLNTPRDPARSCAIANVGVTTMPPRDLHRRLFDEYKVWTVAIDNAGVRGVRVTPHLYTTTAELDTFVGALRQLARG
ncbi:MAG: aminotransferase class V-fold PLP-dependent enzyme [Gemmatimonadaceae bacterium]|jgi:selenocysteine lyase/cysteine desulfurase|nr:aminotransferase class V-fold PLP-dependent enzyme [Gemmatimonadaceae bacterium]